MSRSGPAWVSGNTLVDDDGIPLDEVSVGRDVRVPGVIRTGTQPQNATFGGFETEDVFWAGAELSISTGTPTFVVTNSFPGWQLAATGTNGLITPVFNLPLWYRFQDVHFGMSNDHTATGNTRLRSILRKVDVGGSIQSPTVVSDVTATFASASANGGTTIWVPAPSLAITWGTFGSFFTCEIQRLGDDGADTLAGPIRILAIGFTRKES